MTDNLDRALKQFDALAFAKRHGGYKESRSELSHEYLLPCPKCGSDRLRWRHQPPEKMAYICWGCRKISGDTIHLIQLFERCSEMDAIGYVVDGYVGGDAPTDLREYAVIPQSTKMQLGHLPRVDFPHGYEFLDWNMPGHRVAWRYLLQERGLSADDVRHYRVGYARRGRLKCYVVFPCFMEGTLVYWQARATWDPPAELSPQYRKQWEKDTKYRKVLNPISADGAATASEVLFNYDQASVCEHVVIVEGPVDAMKVGIHAVALLGKAPSPTKIERLLRMHARRYTIYLDRGEAEMALAQGIARELSGFAPVSIAVPPVGRDPGSLTPAQNAQVIETSRPWRDTGLRSSLKIR